jgi:hypothetical protein
MGGNRFPAEPTLIAFFIGTYACRRVHVEFILARSESKMDLQFLNQME